MIRRTISIMLTVLFLVSFTGVRLVMHHCSGCGTSEIVFAAAATDSCCGQTTDASDPVEASVPDISCCVPAAHVCEPGMHDGCCEFEDVYLKGDFTIIIEKVAPRIEVPVVADAIIPAAFVAIAEIADVTSAAYYFTDPPPRLAGRAFVLYTHQLKFC